MTTGVRRVAWVGFWVWSLLAGAGVAQGGEAARSTRLKFTDVTRETGIRFVHDDGSSGRRYIVETVASGLATFDYDGDGDIDILFLNGAALPGYARGTSPKPALYRNEGGWRFVEATESAGLERSVYGLGVCVGDYDNDGDPDVYLNNFGTNVLYRNDGQGRFSDVSRFARVDKGPHVGAGASFLDIDGDGDLDLFVASYIDFDLQKHQTRLVNGHPAYVGPMVYGPVVSTLYRNDGNGTFTDISRESGIAAHPGTGMGVVCADYDDDGDTDIIVGNDAMANFVWRNDGHGRFEEVGLLAGLAYDVHGVGQGTMGVECADYDNDGRLDFQMTSYQRQWALLYRNRGGGFFSDATYASGAGTGSFHQVEWGNGLVDFDNDGDRDLFMACGHLQDNIASWDDTGRYEAPKLLLENDGRGKFADVSASAGDGLRTPYSSRGAAFDDLDGDGDIDVVVLNARREPTLLRNDTDTGGHWARIRLRGTRTNRDGVGARVLLSAGGRRLVDEVHSGRGYQSHFGSDLHFGLGSGARVDRLEVRWVGGGTNVWEGLAVDRTLVVREDGAVDVGQGSSRSPGAASGR